MKFKFSLEKLLQVKEQEEKQLLFFLGECRQRLFHAETKLQLLQKKQLHYSQEMDGKQKFSVAELKLYAQYLPVLADKINKQREECAVIEQEIANFLDQITQLIKERKTLEKLKEKKRQEFLGELNRREQLQLDEVALNLHNHTGNGS